MAETRSDAEITRPKRGPWIAAVLAGLVASVLTWTAGEASVDRFPQKKTGNPLTEGADLSGYNRVLVKNAALTHGLQGAVLGLTLGLAGALASRALASRSLARSGTLAGLAGLVLGGGLGAAGSFGLFSAYFAWVDANAQSMVPSLLTHGGVAALIGGAGGLAFGIGLSGVRRAVRGLVGGLIGATIGAIVVEIIIAVTFPDEPVGAPIASTWTRRLIAHALIDMLACLGAAALVESPSTVVPNKPEPAMID